jgi:hypothetical protein
VALNSLEVVVCHLKFKKGLISMCSLFVMIESNQRSLKVYIDFKPVEVKDYLCNGQYWDHRLQGE